MKNKVCPLMQITKGLNNKMSDIYCIGENCVCYSTTNKIEHCSFLHCWADIKQGVIK